MEPTAFGTARMPRMPSKEVFIQEVDALMRVDKVLIGGESVSWVPGRDDEEWQIKLPLEIEGEQFGHQLVLTANPTEGVGWFSIGLMHGVGVDRLDIVGPYEAHRNPYDALGRKIPTLLYGSHFHRWELNKQFVDSAAKLQRLPMAEPYSESEKLMSALRWYAGERNILVPHDVQIEVPTRQRLI
jgi:hypothetical protein